MASMISVDEARAAIRGALAPLGLEEATLDAAHGRVLAAPVIAAMTQPPFDCAAMDGYAVCAADVRQAGAALKVVGVSSAGERFQKPLAVGTAIRIFTGAPVPEGADHVLIQEEASRTGEEIIVKIAQPHAQHIRRAGVDFRKGDILIPAGARLAGPALALAAAGNIASVSVRRRPRLALIANGDELILPGQLPGSDQIICSIPFGLSAMIAAWGGEAAFLGIAPDDKAGIRSLAEKALDYDVIVPIGGASVGDKDFMRAVFAELGFAAIFEKVSVKPGKPTWFALADKTAVLGLPGNPASALVMAALLLRTAVDRLLGLGEDDAERRFMARAAIPLQQNGPRETYLRARLTEADDGARAATPFENQDSSLLSVMAHADVLIRRAERAPPVPAGGLVECLSM